MFPKLLITGEDFFFFLIKTGSTLYSLIASQIWSMGLIPWTVLAQMGPDLSTWNPLGGGQDSNYTSTLVGGYSKKLAGVRDVRMGPHEYHRAGISQKEPLPLPSHGLLRKARGRMGGMRGGALAAVCCKGRGGRGC